MSEKNRMPQSAIDAFMGDQIAERFSELRTKKDKWIADARQAFSPSERQPCNICKKYKSLSQAHHVIPLSLQFDRGFKKPDDRHVWLCPTHHAAAHIAIAAAWKGGDPRASRATVDLINEMTHEEVTALVDLISMSNFAEGT